MDKIPLVHLGHVSELPKIEKKEKRSVFVGPEYVEMLEDCKEPLKDLHGVHYNPQDVARIAIKALHALLHP